jgi:hypothetical protein
VCVIATHEQDGDGDKSSSAHRPPPRLVSFGLGVRHGVIRCKSAATHVGGSLVGVNVDFDMQPMQLRMAIAPDPDKAHCRCTAARGMVFLM